MRVLLVDDEPKILAFVSKGLEETGYFVTTAESGASAWELLQVIKYDIIVCDLIMPGMNGFQFLTLLRNDARFTNIPFVLAAAIACDALLSDHPDCPKQNDGVTCFIYKPFNPKELIHIMGLSFDRAEAKK